MKWSLNSEPRSLDGDPSGVGGADTYVVFSPFKMLSYINCCFVMTTKKEKKLKCLLTRRVTNDCNKLL